MLPKESPAFWRSIQPASTISISDSQAIAESMKAGRGVKGIDYSVEFVRSIRQEDNFAEWLLFKLADKEQELWFVVKIVDQNIKVGMYYEPDEFEPGDRRDLVNRRDTWLFQEPEDTHKYELADLDYSDEIIWSIQEPGNNNRPRFRDIHYEMRKQGVLYGICTHNPKQAGTEGAMAAVVEYETIEDKDNPELMLIELGGEESDNGGLINLLFGCQVAFSEVDVLNLQETPDDLDDKKRPLWKRLIRKLKYKP